MMAVSPPRRRHRDDGSPRRIKRRASPYRSSDAEADRRRRSEVSPPDLNRRRRPPSRSFALDLNRRRSRDPRPSEDNGHSMPCGCANYRPPRRARVSDGEDDGNRRRRTRFSDDEREDGRRRGRSMASEDERDGCVKRDRNSDSYGRRQRRSPSLEPGSCPDDRRSCRARRDESLWQRDDCRLRKDNFDRRWSRPKRREPMRELDKASPEYQQISWDALKKSINGLVNKVNAINIKNIALDLFAQNLVRGWGLFCQSCIKSQMASPVFSDVFAALIAVVNTKFPEIGRLLLVPVVLELKMAYERNDKPQLLAATKFVAHLVNQVVALDILTVLLENPTDDSVEVAVGFVKECGAKLQALSPECLHAIFERFQGILHEGQIDMHVQFLIKGLFAVRKAKFKGFPAIHPELDLMEQADQFTHEISLEDELDPENNLNGAM